MFKRRTLKRIVFLLFAVPVMFAVAAWTYRTFFLEMDTSEINVYYDILSENGTPSGYLVLDLGVTDPEDVQVAINRMKDVMGLSKYDIWLKHTDKKEPPAYIENLGYGVMGIYLSNGVKEMREQLNVLTHEMCHIYVWRVDDKLSPDHDEEKVVDTAGVYLGMGILILNGLTEDMLFLPGTEFQSRKKFYGYIQPQQFGYLLARYCAEHGVSPAVVEPFLNSTGRKYFAMGCDVLKKDNTAWFSTVTNVTGVYWCAECGHRIEVPLDVPVDKIKCPKCGYVRDMRKSG